MDYYSIRVRGCRWVGTVEDTIQERRDPETPYLHEAKTTMKYYWMRPEVAGGLGPRNDYNVSRTPSLIGTLHFEFVDWAGDDIVTTSGFWLVTRNLAAALKVSSLTGWQLDDVRLTFSDYWRQPPCKEFPVWRRLVPTGASQR